ncbi:MAG: NUDIX hydrolase [Bacilli bacterium]|jgi:ADP-ribose pyrophosphatase
MKEKRSESNYLYRGRILNLRRDKVLLPDGREAFREVVEHSGAVACLVLTPEGKAVFVRQFRAPLGKEILEVPAGRIDGDESPEAAMRRELREEVGIEALKLEHAGSILPSPGYTDEVIHLFYTDSYERAEGEKDADEFLEIVEIDGAEALAMAREGRISDAKTLCLLLLYKEKLMKEGER